MSKLQVLRSLVQRKAVIEFLPNVRERAPYLSPGLRGTVTDIDVERGEWGGTIYCLTLNFMEHEEHNDRVTIDGDYNPTGVFFVGLTDETDLFFKVIDTEGAEILRLHYESTGAKESYVSWLEQQLLKRM